VKEYEYTANKDNTVITGIPFDTDTMDASQEAELSAHLAKARETGQKIMKWGGTTPAAQMESADTSMDPVKPTLMQQIKSIPQAVKDFVLPGGTEEVKRNLGAALRGVAGGAASTAGIVVDPITAVANLLMPGKQDAMTLNQSVQMLLSRAGVPEAETEAEKIMQAAVGGLSSGGVGVVAGRAMTKIPGAINAIGDAMSAAPLSQLTGGAGSDAGGEVAGMIAENYNAPPLVQAGAQLAGSILGGGAGALANNPTTPGIVSAANESKIPLYTTDVFPPKTALGKSAQNIGDMIPFAGTGGQRVSQQAKRVEAVDDIIRQYDASDLEGTSAEVMKDLIAKVGPEGSFFKKWGSQKNEVIERLSEVDIEPVQLTRTNAKIDESIEALKALKSDQYQPVINVLEDWKQALNGQNLANVETLRKDVGKAFSNPNFTGPKETGDKILSSIYKPLNEDMGDYIKKIGTEADYNKWKVANTELSKKIEELKLPVLKTVLEKGEATPNEVNKLLFSKNSSDIRALYRNLSPEGRSFARSAVIAKAAEKSGGASNPNAFASEVDKLGKSVGVLFSGEDLQQVNGLTKALNMTRRAQEAGVSPKNGFQALLPLGLFGAGAMADRISKDPNGTIIAGVAAEGIGLIPRMYDSKPVRNILINLSQVKDDTPEAKALLSTLITTINSQKPGNTTE
jgi:hypothetical protein